MRPLKDYLVEMVKREASDLYLTTSAAPSMKVHGKLIHMDEPELEKDAVKIAAEAIMNPKQLSEFEETHEMNLAVSESGVGRFRVNIFQQRNQVGMVLRHIKTEIPTVDELKLPTVLTELIMEKRGLILFVGATGSGKSTTMAALIQHRNHNSADHIITIEDPIEYIHNHDQSIVNQREVGIDTESYQIALKNTLRQAPDVIQIGEIRSDETMEHAIAFSETGHLCISTLHANNANQALDRIINFFPEEKHNQVKLDLAFNVRAIISQRLIPSLDNKRVLATEVMINSPLISDLIRRGEFHEIKEIMQKSEALGMMTFDSCLFNLYENEKISAENAIRYADSKNNMRLRITVKESDGDAGSLDIMEEDKDTTGSSSGMLRRPSKKNKDSD